MSDPAKLGLGDWAMEIVGGLLVALGVGGVTMFNNAIHSAKAKIDKRLDDQDARMDQHTEKHFSHETQLAVIHSNQDHMTNRLDEIRECTNKTNEKLNDLADTLTQVLIAVKK